MASKGSEREAARPRRRGICFVFAQPIRRPQLSSATVQATNNVLDRGHQQLSIMHNEANKRTSRSRLDGHVPGRRVPSTTYFEANVAPRRFHSLPTSIAPIAPLTKRHSPISCVRKPRERLRSRRRADEGKFTTDRNPDSVLSALISPCRCLFPGFVACWIVIGNARA